MPIVPSSASKYNHQDEYIKYRCLPLEGCHLNQRIGASLHSELRCGECCVRTASEKMRDELRCLPESKTMHYQIAMTLPDVEVESLRRTLDARLPRYAVILHNDDYHSMDYVVEALVKSVPDLIVEEAVGIMFEAHNTGSAVVVVCVLEQAELYKERIQGYGLGVSIRRD